MDNARKKRACKRKAFTHPVDLEMSCMEKGRLGIANTSGAAINISSGGVRLSTAYALTQGEVLKLYFPAIARSAALPVFSEVVWVKQAGSHVVAGLRFLA